MHQRTHRLKSGAEGCNELAAAVQRKIDLWKTCAFHSLQRSNSTAGDIIDCRGKVRELKDRLGILQDTYLQTKTLKESKREQWLSNVESLSSTKRRTKDLKKMMQVLSERRHEREEIISEQLRGIKFIFVNIELARPDREFSFTIHHSRGNDCYTLLECDPCLESSRELLDELNQTNDLFKFVRVMRETFQTLSLKGQEVGKKVANLYVARDEINAESDIPVFP